MYDVDGLRPRHHVPLYINTAHIYYSTNAVVSKTIQSDNANVAAGSYPFNCPPTITRRHTLGPLSLSLPLSPPLPLSLLSPSPPSYSLFASSSPALLAPSKHVDSQRSSNASGGSGKGSCVQAKDHSVRRTPLLTRLAPLRPSRAAERESRACGDGPSSRAARPALNGRRGRERTHGRTNRPFQRASRERERGRERETWRADRVVVGTLQVEAKSVGFHSRRSPRCSAWAG